MVVTPQGICPEPQHTADKPYPPLTSSFQLLPCHGNILGRLLKHLQLVTTLQEEQRKYHLFFNPSAGLEIIKVSPVMLFRVSSCNIEVKHIHRKVCPEPEMGMEMSIPTLTMGSGGGEHEAPLLSTHGVQGRG